MLTFILLFGKKEIDKLEKKEDKKLLQVPGSPIPNKSGYAVATRSKSAENTNAISPRGKTSTNQSEAPIEPTSPPNGPEPDKKEAPVKEEKLATSESKESVMKARRNLKKNIQAPYGTMIQKPTNSFEHNNSTTPKLRRIESDRNLIEEVLKKKPLNKLRNLSLEDTLEEQLVKSKKIVDFELDDFQNRINLELVKCQFLPNQNEIVTPPKNTNENLLIVLKNIAENFQKLTVEELMAGAHCKSIIKQIQNLTNEFSDSDYKNLLSEFLFIISPASRLLLFKREVNKMKKLEEVEVQSPDFDDVNPLNAFSSEFTAEFEKNQMTPNDNTQTMLAISLAISQLLGFYFPSFFSCVI